MRFNSELRNKRGREALFFMVLLGCPCSSGWPYNHTHAGSILNGYKEEDEKENMKVEGSIRKIQRKLEGHWY